MGNDKSTPRPWNVEENAFGEFGVTADNHSLIVARMIEMFGHGCSKANAELIVRSVNSHNALVDCVKQFIWAHKHGSEYTQEQAFQQALNVMDGISPEWRTL